MILNFKNGTTFSIYEHLELGWILAITWPDPQKPKTKELHLVVDKEDIRNLIIELQRAFAKK